MPRVLAATARKQAGRSEQTRGSRLPRWRCWYGLTGAVGDWLRRERAAGDERQSLLHDTAAGDDGKAAERRQMGVVEWEQIFASEKAKIEAGEDPEGDGLTDVSDSEGTRADKARLGQ